MVQKGIGRARVMRGERLRRFMIDGIFDSAFRIVGMASTPHPDTPGEPSRDAGAAMGDLGWREREVLGVIRELGSATVQQVAGRLSASPAYTTVMTTLDRLFRKGLLRREKQSRAFLYSAALSPQAEENLRAADLVRRFFSQSRAQPDLLVSCLIDAVHQYDTDLLDQLEARLRAARAAAPRKEKG